MSSPLEQRLQITIKKIVELLKADLTEFDSDRVLEMPLEEEIIDLESSIEDLDNLIRGLCAAKDEINSVFEDWTELNKKASAAERPEFDASFKAFELKHRPSQYAAEAEKKLTSLRMSKSKLSRKLRLKKLNLRRENAQIEQAPQHRQIPWHRPDLWPDWWELFMSIHEDSGLSTERKFLYLRSFIPQESPAGLLIDGFQPSEYGQAIDLLKQNYENKDRRIRNLQQQLLTLPHCNTLEDVRKFYLNLERICRQLAGLGNDTDSDFYYNLLETKLTRPMLREILAVKKEAGDSWTTSKFRLELKRLLESEMEISSILKKMGDEKKGEEKKQFSKPKDEPHTPKRTGNEKRMSPRDEDDSPPPTVACPTVGKTNRKETNWAEKFATRQPNWSTPTRGFALSGEQSDQLVDWRIIAPVVSDQGLAVKEAQHNRLLGRGSRSLNDPAADTVGSFGALREYDHTLASTFRGKRELSFRGMKRHSKLSSALVAWKLGSAGGRGQGIGPSTSHINPGVGSVVKTRENI
uniref:Uncharacterized protein n=1 Tax=Meloidogyne floridensis TaxID=298350 RepID=A0A915NMG5_9BILA